MKHHTSSAGASVTVPVRVCNFIQLISAQGTIQFDPAVATFVSVQDYGISGMNASCFGTSQVGSGKLTFSWADLSLVGYTLPDSAILFSVTFQLAGQAGQQSALTFTGSPTLMEVVDASFGTPAMILVNGGLHIEQNLPVVTLRVDTVSGWPGSQVSLSIRALNFKNINSLQGSLSFNPALISFSSVGFYGLPGMGAGDFGLTQTAAGKLTFAWTDASLTGQNMPDGSPLFTIVFGVLGAPGSIAAVRLTNQPTALEVSDSLFNILSVDTVGGRVKITSPSVGISDDNPQSGILQIFPNPSPGGVFSVRLGEAVSGASYAVFDAMGSRVDAGFMASANGQLSISAVQGGGVYTVVFYLPGGRRTARLVVLP